MSTLPGSVIALFAHVFAEVSPQQQVRENPLILAGCKRCRRPAGKKTQGQLAHSSTAEQPTTIPAIPRRHDDSFHARPRHSTPRRQNRPPRDGPVLGATTRHTPSPHLSSRHDTSRLGATARRP